MDSNKHRIIVNPYAKSRKRPRQPEQQPRQQPPILRLSSIKTNNDNGQTQNDVNGHEQRNPQAITANQIMLLSQATITAATSKASKPPPAQPRPTSPPLIISNPYAKSRMIKPTSPNTTNKSHTSSRESQQTSTLNSPSRSVSPPLVYNPYSKANRKKPNQSTNNVAAGPHYSSTATSRIQKPSKPPSLSQEDASALIISASDKAGMDGIDRSKIDAIILRESGNSLYMQQQKRRDAKVNQKIVAMQAQKEALLLAPAGEFNEDASLERQLQSWQAACPSRSTKVVVDMDMFYMACELLSKPHLDQHPACVGRGMVLTSNYKARQYGVRSAMAGFVADKLVEELSNGTERLIHVPSHFSLYKEKSQQVKEVLREYDPHLKSYSLDEAYLDLGPYLAIYLEQQESIDPMISNNIGTILTDDLHRSIRNILMDRLTDRTEETSSDTKGSHETNGEEVPSAVQDSSEMDGEDDDDGIGELNQEGLQEEMDSDGDQKETNAEEIKCRRPHYDYMKELKKFSVEVCNNAIQTVVHHMRSQVQVRTGGLTCSAGIAAHSGLAKMASDINKPNGQLLVDPHKVLEFLHPLAARKVPGIGRVTQKILQHVLQVDTVQDLYQQRVLVSKLFQKATATYLLKASVGHIGTNSTSASNGNSFASFGTNPDEVNDEDDHQKGMSRERTFRPESNYQKLQEKMDSIADTLSNDMMKKKVKAHTITVKVKLFTFDVFSRAKSLDRNVYIQDAEELKVVARELLASIRTELASKHAKDDDGKEDGTRGADKSTISGSNSDEGHELCCRLLGIRCSSLMHQDALPQQKPMDKFLTRKKKDHEGEQGSSEAARIPSSEKENSVSSNNQSTKETQVEQESNTCPLCNSIIVGDNDVLNRHIDTCLNSSTVRRVVREVTQYTQEESTATDSKKKASHKQKLTDFW